MEKYLICMMVVLISIGAQLLMIQLAIFHLKDYLKTITEELISRNGFLKEIRRIAEDDGK